MNYLSINVIEMQARADKPYMCEMKPAVVSYLERALTGKLSDTEINETQLPLKYVDCLKYINKNCKYDNQMMSLNVVPNNNDSGLYLLMNDNGTKTEIVVNEPSLVAKMIEYFSILVEVMKNYIVKVIEAVRSKPGILINQVMHNQNRYIQLAYASNPSEFKLHNLSDLDLYSYTMNANLENVLSLQPFMSKIKIAQYLRMVPVKDGETMSYSLQNVGLTSRNIIPKLGARIRLMARGERAASRALTLDFLNDEDEF